MSARVHPLQTPADLRAERHARALSQSQTADRPDPQVLRLAAAGYVPLQIASLLRLPVLDVRLMLATQTTTTRGTR
jgi:hypothetical protein